MKTKNPYKTITENSENLIKISFNNQRNKLYLSGWLCPNGDNHFPHYLRSYDLKVERTQFAMIKNIFLGVVGCGFFNELLNRWKETRYCFFGGGGCG